MPARPRHPRLPRRLLRRFQEDLQSFCAEHGLIQKDLVYYLRELRVHKSRISLWLPEQPGAPIKDSNPSAPTPRQLGHLLGRLLVPDRITNKAHQITPEQARQLFNAYLRLHQYPDHVVPALTGQSEQLKSYEKAINWHHRLLTINLDMAAALVEKNRTADHIEMFITSSALPELVRFFHDLHGMSDDRQPRRFRAVIYTRREKDPTELGIRWAEGFEHESDARLHDRFYCGGETSTPDDPTILARGGLAGWVFVEGEGKVINDAPAHRRFLNVYGERRRVPKDVPFDAALLTIIRGPEHQPKMGLLCVDSKGYSFTEDDLDLVNHLAKLIGWLLHTTGTPYAAQ